MGKLSKFRRGSKHSAALDGLADSLHDLSGLDHLSEREASSSWFRSGVSITDVYDVVEVLGQGTMGEVFTVRRKVTGHHTDLTREKVVENERELERLKLEEEAKEKARAEGKGKRATFKKIPSRIMGKQSGGSFEDVAPLSAPGRRRSTVGGAAHKAKKELKKAVGKQGDGKEVVLREDENFNLARFIDAEDDCQSQRPTCSPGTPLKSIMKDSSVSKFNSSSSRADSDQQSDSGSSYGRKNTDDSPSEPKPLKGVHFQRTFAVKTILTSRINKDQVQELVNEIKIMRKLDHPYVLKLYEVYHVKRKLWLVTELLQGGDLSSRKLNEHDTKNVIEQVLRALVYLHRMGVVHRDIKLENVLYENHSQQATVRLIDFGLSRTFDRTTVAADYTRTPYTLSPETAESMSARGATKLTDKTDVWAVGVIAFVMLSGEFPFIKTNTDLKDQDRIENLKKAKYCFGVTWKGRGISEKAKEFVKGCLERDPNKRWTARQALENIHKSWAPVVDKVWDEWQAGLKKRGQTSFIPPQDLPQEDQEDHNDGENGDADSQISGSAWLADNDDDGLPPPAHDNHSRAEYIKAHVQRVVRKKKAEGSIRVNESVQINMDEVEKYTKFGLMKKTVLHTMANTMDRGDVVKLRELFLEADTKDTGTITLEELIQTFHKVSQDVNEKRAVELFSGIDRDKSGHIHYAEFLAALAESHGLVTLDRLGEAFDRIDTDGKGYITHEDLKSILGKDYDKETVDKMIEEGDFKKNNKIDYEELLQLMFSDPAKGDDLAGSISPSVSFGDE